MIRQPITASVYMLHCPNIDCLSDMKSYMVYTRPLLKLENFLIKKINTKKKGERTMQTFK